MTATERLAAAPEGWVATLEPAKAARFKAATMLIPSPAQLQAALQEIARGQTRTVKEIRTELARVHGADVTCPRATTIAWQLIAEASVERGEDLGPWWRLTRDGKPEKRLPGGVERQRELLLAEGVTI